MLTVVNRNMIDIISNSLIDCCFPGVWNAQHIPNSFECFKGVIKRRLEDQFIQWSEKLFNIVANVQTIGFSKPISF